MRRSFWRPAALLVLLALALALRLYRLDGQSLWNDEGTSVALAARDLATITRNAAQDIHPPLYYYALHFWVRLFGNSEVAVRSLSALYGALTVLVVCGLARRLYGRRVAIVAGALAAVSPLQVYYSQEARMYAQVTLLGALSFWLFAAWADDLLPSAGGEAMHAPWWRPVAYVLVTACALYSQYLALTLVAAQNALFLCRVVACCRSLPGRESPLRCAAGAIWRWGVSQLALLLLFLPWLRVAWPQLRAWPAVSEPFTAGTLLTRALYDLSVGITFPRASWVLAGCAVILIVGWAIARWQDLWAAAVAWGYLLIPLALVYFLSQQRPMYNAKFVLLVAPAFALVLARAIVISRPTAGSSRLARWLRVAWPVGAMAFLLGVSALSLDRNYHDSRYARDDYRAIARYIAAAGQVGDAILINAPSQVETFGYYYHGPLPVHPLPRQRPIDTVATARDLQSLVTESKNIYAILWATDESDPEGFIEGWLEQHTYKALDVWYGNLRFVMYAVSQGDGLSASWKSAQADFGPIRLQRYALLTPQATAGQVLQLSLVWEALSPLDRRYKVFVHVLDADGHIVGQRDAEPSGGRLTPTWQPGEEIVDHHGILILPGTPPGLHQLAIGLYDLETGQRLPLAGDGDDDRLFLPPVEIVKPATPLPLGIMGIQHPLDVSADGLMLRGFNLTRLGDVADQCLFRPGDVLHLTLFWQLLSPVDRELAVSVRLLNGRGEEAWRQRYSLAGGHYPPWEWGSGEIVRDQYYLFLPGDLREGQYALSLSLEDKASRRSLLPALTLRKLQIR